MPRPPLPPAAEVHTAIAALEHADDERRDFRQLAIEQAITVLRKVAAHLGAPAKKA